MAKSKKCGNFCALTWLIFADLITRTTTTTLTHACQGLKTCSKKLTQTEIMYVCNSVCRLYCMYYKSLRAMKYHSRFLSFNDDNDLPTVLNPHQSHSITASRFTACSNILEYSTVYLTHLCLILFGCSKSTGSTQRACILNSCNLF